MSHALLSKSIIVGGGVRDAEVRGEHVLVILPALLSVPGITLSSAGLHSQHLYSLALNHIRANIDSLIFFILIFFCLPGKGP